MSFNPKKVSSITSRGIKVALFGDSGVGKTWQIRTLNRPFVVSAEKGLLTLSRYAEAEGILYGEIKSMADLKECRIWLQNNPDEYETIVLDSVSEIAEICLAEAKKSNKDSRKAYGDMMDIVMEEIKAFLNIEDKDMVFIFQNGRIEDSDSGKVLYSPITPSTKFAAKMPYLFDEVLAVRARPVKDEEGNTQIDRYIQCQNDGVWNCKDRSGYLYIEENADLGALLRIIHNKGVDPLTPVAEEETVEYGEE